MQHFQQLEGNDLVKKRLQKMLDKNAVPHLLLFHGPSDVGKQHFATSFAYEWLCAQTTKKLSFQTVDLHMLVPEGKTGMLSINRVKQLIQTLSLTPFEAGGIATIITDAERMLPSSANALLKMLEEPPSNTLIILCTSTPEKLLGTIYSRCQKVAFRPLSQKREPLCGEVYEELFNFLISSKGKNFIEMAEGCQALHKMIDGRRKNKESSLKEAIREVVKELPSGSKELLELEIEGAVALFWIQEVERLLKGIFAFYRDLEAIHSAETSSLYFAHKKEELIGAYNQGRMMPLERVEELLCWAKQATERSTPLPNVLETLFLQLF